jgi:hypothetical protein
MTGGLKEERLEGLIGAPVAVGLTMVLFPAG